MIDADRLPTLTASRVSLRWLTEKDVDALFAIFSDPEVMRYWSSPPLSDIAGARKLLDEINAFFHQRVLFQWGLARRGDDLVIGTCTLNHLDIENRREWCARA